MKGASQSFYFLTFLWNSFSLNSFSSEIDGQTVFVTKVGKKHPKCSRFRYLKTEKSNVDISDINVIVSQDLGLARCYQQYLWTHKQ